MATIVSRGGTGASCIIHKQYSHSLLLIFKILSNNNQDTVSVESEGGRNLDIWIQ